MHCRKTRFGLICCKIVKEESKWFVSLLLYNRLLILISKKEWDLKYYIHVLTKVVTCLKILLVCCAVFEKERWIEQGRGSFWFLEPVYGAQCDRIMHFLVACVVMSLVLVVVTVVGYGLMVCRCIHESIVADVCMCVNDHMLRYVVSTFLLLSTCATCISFHSLVLKRNFLARVSFSLRNMYKWPVYITEIKNIYIQFNKDMYIRNWLITIK